MLYIPYAELQMGAKLLHLSCGKNCTEAEIIITISTRQGRRGRIHYSTGEFSCQVILLGVCKSCVDLGLQLRLHFFKTSCLVLTEITNRKHLDNTLLTQDNLGSKVWQVSEI